MLAHGVVRSGGSACVRAGTYIIGVLLEELGAATGRSAGDLAAQLGEAVDSCTGGCLSAA